MNTLCPKGRDNNNNNEKFTIYILYAIDVVIYPVAIISAYFMNKPLAMMSYISIW